MSQPCILDDDLQTVKALLDAQGSYDGYVVGVPRASVADPALRPGWLPRFLGTARSAFYDPDRGFLTE